MIPVRILPQATRDLLGIADYLSVQTDSGEVGDRFLEAASETIHLLANAPLLGRRRSSSHPLLEDLRALAVKRPFERYIIYHQPQGAALLVLRVLHSAQNAHQLLSIDSEKNA